MVEGVLSFGERGALLCLIGVSACFYWRISMRFTSFLRRMWGCERGLKFLMRGLKDFGGRDRNYIDRLNWSFFW